jgi:hypothetical protein
MTTFADPTEEANEPKGSKALAIGAVIFVILALLIGGWLAWSKLFAGQTESGELDVGTIPDRFRPRAVMAVPAPPPVKDGVNKLAGNLYRIQAGEFSMTLAPTETTYAPIRLLVNRRDVITADQRLLIRFCQETANAAVAKSLEVTPDQAKQLLPVRQQMNGGMKISDADRNKLKDEWKAWNAAKDLAAKSAAEATLLASMKDVGNRSLDATKQQYADLTAQIRKIVTDQQLARFRQTRGG